MPSIVTRLVSKARRLIFKALISVDKTVQTERLGSEYGGWWVPTSLKESGVCVSAGVGEDITFDIAIIRKFGLKVIALDPTPKAIAYVKTYPDLPDGFVFDPIGLWSSDTTLKFFVPKNPTFASYSATNLQHTDNSIDCKAERLATIMDRHKVGSLEILKVDIEGAEFTVLDDLIDSRIRPRVLCIEFDQPATISKIRDYVSRLVELGYVVAKVEDWNVTFVIDCGGE